MSEIPGEIYFAEPNPEPEPVPRWKFALTLGEIAFLLLLWVLVTVIIIPYPDDKIEISVVTILPSETLIRRLKLPNDANLIPVQGPIEARLEKFLESAENVSTDGLRVEWWDSGMNQTIPCKAVGNVYLEDDHNDYVEAFKLFEWIGNETAVSVDGKCEYSVSLVQVTDTRTMLINLWIMYGVLMLLELYILIMFKLTNNMYIALLLSSIGIAVLAALGSWPTEHTIISWEMKN